jgi:hypothetical protein
MTMWDFINDSPFVAFGLICLIFLGVESLILAWRRK